MVDFGGWDMPVEYSGIIAEHKAVRQAVGLFDVSHMGEIEIAGPQALDLVELAASNRAASLKDGQAQYSGLLNERGGFIDDLLVHRFSDERFFLCVNAGNQETDFEHIQSLNQSTRADAQFVSDRYAQIAVQGPKGLATLQKLTGTPLSDLRYYWFTEGKVSGAPAIIARTGYTGEDGFEIYVAPDEAERLWAELLQAGAEYDIIPCGLGCRNTLRMEAAMALHGHEISEEITPFEAGLGWIVKLNKGDFVGRDALLKQKQEGVPRQLVGFEMRGRGIARDGYPVMREDEQVGFVTSGSPAPFLEKNIGMALLQTDVAKSGGKIDIQVRTRGVEAEIVPLPFYSRKKD
jgi:aminomethyltransferase